MSAADNPMELKVRVVSQYGKIRIQPICARAELFAYLCRGKTMTEDDIKTIKKLGFTVTVVQEEVTL